MLDLLTSLRSGGDLWSKRFEKSADRIDERLGRSPARIASPWQYPIGLHGQLLNGAGLNENAGGVVDAAAIEKNHESTVQFPVDGNDWLCR